MVGGLVLAWLPMNLINLWRDFAPSNNFSTWYTLIFATCHVVGFFVFFKIWFFNAKFNPFTEKFTFLPEILSLLRPSSYSYREF